MNEYACTRCKLIKDVDDFFWKKKISHRCCGCNKEVAKEIADALRKTPENKLRLKNYLSSPGTKKARAKAKADWVSRNKQKYLTQIKTRSAIKSGVLKRLPCIKCGEWAEAHHEDYSKHLDIVWLCPLHHRERHKELRNGI